MFNEATVITRCARAAGVEASTVRLIKKAGGLSRHPYMTTVAAAEALAARARVRQVRNDAELYPVLTGPVLDDVDIELTDAPVWYFWWD